MFRIRKNKRTRKPPVYVEDNFEISLENDIDSNGKSINSNILLKTCIAFLGMLTEIVSINDAFELKLNLIVVTLVLGFVLFLLSYITFSSRNGRRLIPAILIGAVVIGIVKIKALFNGGGYVTHIIGKQIGRYYGMNFPDSNIPVNDSLQSEITFFVIFLCCVVGWLMILFSWKKIRPILFFFLGEAGIILVFASGLVISRATVILGMIYCTSVIVCGLSHLSDRHVTRILQRRAIFCFLPLVGIVIISYLVFFPVSKYKKNEAITQVKKTINKNMTKMGMGNLLDNINGGNSSRDGLAEGGRKSRMGTVAEMNLSDDTDLVVEMKKTDSDYGILENQNVYLRGFVGSVYNDSTWYASESEVPHSNKVDKYGKMKLNLTFPYQMQGQYIDIWGAGDIDYQKYDMEIQSRGTKSFQYVPYYTLDFSYGGITDDKGITAQKNRYHYTVYGLEGMGSIDGYDSFPELAFGGSLDSDDSSKYLSDKYDSDKSSDSGYTYGNNEMASSGYYEEWYMKERQYYDYVNETYLQMPDEKEMPRFYEKFKKMEIEYDGEMIDLEGRGYQQSLGLKPYVDFVKNFLKDYPYTLKPGKLDMNKDFVEDFMFDKKRGYCTYFASAATLMFRKMGIPARYVEGYLITEDMMQQGNIGKSQTLKKIDVPNKQSHAWVEIYLPQFGWIPIEVTTGFGDSENNINGMSQKETVQSQQETTANAQNETTAEEMQSEKSNTGDQKTQQGDGYLDVKSMVIMLIVLITPLGSYLALLRRRDYILNRRKLRLNTKQFRNSLYLVFKERGITLENGMLSRDAARLAGEKFMTVSKDEFLYLFRCMDKEKYTRKESLTMDELEECNRIITQMGNEIYKNSSIWMQFKIYYIWCMK